MRKLKKYNNIPYCLVMGGRNSGKSPFTPFMIKIQDLEEQLKLTEKALELACEEINRVEAKFGSAYIRANGYLVDYFKTKAKEI